ncbi:MAG: endonuclease Q family protein [Patescibacteria group bacterium]|nr:endonuclease Q family protein [Patescibacteria group bacterium]
MRIIADLHLHSRFSRSCSKDLTISNIAKACELKGINMVGTADALHPEWRKEIGELLELRDGAYYLKDGSSKTAFILSTEVACIYKRHDKVRRLHHVLYFPDLEAVDKTITALNERGRNLRSDGRPILGMDSEDLLKMLLEIDERILLVPAHAWTPWFAIFGSKSGFDSIEECFGDYSKYIYAIETGLSSDPVMNWRISALDNVFLISNSDAHSCNNLGREANVFEMEKPSYDEFRRILIEHDLSKFLETIEFFPEEGKYHADGCAGCKFWCEPEKSKKLAGRCPKCGKLLTIGVLSRVSDLADRDPNPTKPISAVPFRHVVPLKELIADSFGKRPQAKAVILEYERMVSLAGEFAILLDMAEKELLELTSPEIATGILRMRTGNVCVRPGYDGIYGEIHVYADEDRSKQVGLF